MKSLRISQPTTENHLKIPKANPNEEQESSVPKLSDALIRLPQNEACSRWTISVGTVDANEIHAQDLIGAAGSKETQQRSACRLSMEYIARTDTMLPVVLPPNRKSPDRTLKPH